MKFREWKRRGQVMVLWALLTPLLICFIGLGMDLGWYYLNVSRLQNAADAAVVAGAKALLEDSNFKDAGYKYVHLVDKYPGDSPDGTSTETGDKVAESYVIKNLGANQKVYGRDSEGKLLDSDGKPISDSENYTVSADDDGNWVVKDSEGNTLDGVIPLIRDIIVDNWSRGGNGEVTMEPSLYKVDDNFYYVVRLTENIKHMFLGGWSDMNAPVVAVAMLSKNTSTGDGDDDNPLKVDIDINTILEFVEKGGEVVTDKDGKITQIWINESNDKVAKVNYGNKRIIDSVKNTETVIENYTDEQLNALLREGETATKFEPVIIGNWEYFNARNKNKELYSGNWNQFQNNDVKDTTKGLISYDKAHKVVYRTENMTVEDGKEKIGSKKTEWEKLDSINIDFIAEFQLNSQFTEDWDLREGHPPNLSGYRHSDGNWSKTIGYDLRIHSSITFGEPYKNRPNYSTPDPLWVSIEKEPILPLDENPTHASYNSVRQIIFNINGDNYNVNTHRPMVIFYEGPEQFSKNNTVRVSQPVVVNLNQNFNGILYMPNSPVVINGNEHKFTGFVVAKEFLALKTKKEDYLDNGYKEVKDDYNNTILIEPEYLENVPKYFIIDAHYVKKLEGYNDNDYVATLKKYEDISDAEAAEKIVPITFPKTDAFGAANSTQTYHVVKKYLKNESDLPPGELAKHTNKDNFKTAEYAKVICNGEEKYILKTKLPYVRVYIYKDGNKYPYVPVCDLKIAKDFPTSNIYKVNGATLADDEHDAYKSTNGQTFDIDDRYIIDPSRDMWKVVAVKDNWWNDTDSNANPAVITKVIDEKGYKYFIRKYNANELNTLVEKGTLRKVYLDNETYYIRENESVYYIEFIPEGSDPEGKGKNPIIVDKKGDLQTKALPEGSTRPTNLSEQPNSLFDRTRIKDKSLEVVYKNTAFNLSSASRYSSFGIKTDVKIGETTISLPLKRKYYDYLDKESPVPVDMFFTTERSKWIE